MTNTFWIAANIIFDIATGNKSEVLMLVNHEGDATFFTQKDADTYFGFIAARAPNIVWSIDTTRLRGKGDLFVIRGVQNVG
jgi:hypothetical protein